MIEEANSTSFSGSVWNSFNLYYYYVIITLWRTPASAQNPVVYGVSLTP